MVTKGVEMRLPPLVAHPLLSVAEVPQEQTFPVQRYLMAGGPPFDKRRAMKAREEFKRLNLEGSPRPRQPVPSLITLPARTLVKLSLRRAARPVLGVMGAANDLDVVHPGDARVVFEIVV